MSGGGKPIAGGGESETDSDFDELAFLRNISFNFDSPSLSVRVKKIWFGMENGTIILQSWYVLLVSECMWLWQDIISWF